MFHRLKNKLFISRDIIHDETIFLFKTMIVVDQFRIPYIRLLKDTL